MTEKFRLDGIHYKKGTIPGLDFDIYLQLNFPDVVKRKKKEIK